MAMTLVRAAVLMAVSLAALCGATDDPHRVGVRGRLRGGGDSARLARPAPLALAPASAPLELMPDDTSPAMLSDLPRLAAANASALATVATSRCDVLSRNPVYVKKKFHAATVAVAAGQCTVVVSPEDGGVTKVLLVDGGSSNKQDQAQQSLVEVLTNVRTQRPGTTLKLAVIVSHADEDHHNIIEAAVNEVVASAPATGAGAGAASAADAVLLCGSIVWGSYEGDGTGGSPTSFDVCSAPTAHWLTTRAWEAPTKCNAVPCIPDADGLNNWFFGALVGQAGFSIAVSTQTDDLPRVDTKEGRKRANNLGLVVRITINHVELLLSGDAFQQASIKPMKRLPDGFARGATAALALTTSSAGATGAAVSTVRRSARLTPPGSTSAAVKCPPDAPDKCLLAQLVAAMKAGVHGDAAFKNAGDDLVWLPLVCPAAAHAGAGLAGAGGAAAVRPQFVDVPHHGSHKTSMPAFFTQFDWRRVRAFLISGSGPVSTLHRHPRCDAIARLLLSMHHCAMAEHRGVTWTFTAEPGVPALMCYEGGKNSQSSPLITLTATHAVAVAADRRLVADFELWPTHSLEGGHNYVLSIDPSNRVASAAVCLRQLASTAFPAIA